VVLGVLLWTGWAGAQEAGTTGALSLHRSCIDEPVFGQQACIYEANPTAQKTVVLVHGLNGEALRDWERQIPVLARYYHVLTFDLPGFGKSDKGAEYYDPSSYARFIHYVIGRYARRPFYLVGHSMGGAIALRYSADHPEDVDRLVLADVAGVLHRLAYTRMLAAAWANEKYGDGLGGFFDKMIYKFMTKLEGDDSSGNESLAHKLLEHEMQDAEPQVIAAYTLANEDLSDALERIKVPVLLLWGDNDKVAPLRTAKVLQARLPRTRLVRFAGAGHMPMREAPEPFNQALLSFLAQPPSEEDDTAPPVSTQLLLPSMPPATAQQKLECQSQRNKVYEGEIGQLVLEGCDDVVVRNATIGSLQTMESRVRIENSRIGTDDGTGLTSIGSEVMITASEISGSVAIQAWRSRFDMAAVRVTGSVAAVSGAGSSLLFSVSKLYSPRYEGNIHGHYEVERNKPL